VFAKIDGEKYHQPFLWRRLPWPSIARKNTSLAFADRLLSADLNDARLPVENVLGESPGHVIASHLNWAGSVGRECRGRFADAWSKLFAYAKQRRAFNKPISDLASSAKKLADQAVGV